MPKVPGGLRQCVRHIKVDGTMKEYSSLRAAADETGINIPRLKRLIEKKEYYKDGSRFEYGPLVPRKEIRQRSLTIYLDPVTYGLVALEAARHSKKPSRFVTLLVEHYAKHYLQSAQIGPDSVPHINVDILKSVLG